MQKSTSGNLTGRAAHTRRRVWECFHPQAVLLGSGHVDGEFRALAEGEFRCSLRVL